MKHTELTGLEVFLPEAGLPVSRRYKISPDSNVFSFRRGVPGGHIRRLSKSLIGTPCLRSDAYPCRRQAGAGRRGRRNRLTGYRQQERIRKIKFLVKSGRYETEEKIKITAARILEAFQSKID